MNIYRLENNKEIYENDAIIKLMRVAMFNATDGRIKSAAEGIYGKQQGHFYVADSDGVIGIIGVRRVDNAYVEIMHLAVVEEHRNTGVGKGMINYVRDAERVDEIIVHTDTDIYKYFEKLGFSIEEEEDNMTGLVRFTCRTKG